MGFISAAHTVSSVKAPLER